VSINSETGHTSTVADLSAAPPILAVSTFSRVQRVYYYISAATANIHRVNVHTRKHLSPITISKSTGNNRVIAMAHSESQDLIYALEAPWPVTALDSIALAVYSPRRGAVHSRHITSLEARDVSFGALPAIAFKVSQGEISIFGVNGAHTRYVVATNVTTRTFVDWLGQPVYFGNLRVRIPELSAISTPPHPSPTSSFVVTVTGANFGLNDVGQIVKIGEFECAESIWISDYAITCRLPDFTVSEALREDSTMMDSASRIDLSVHVPQTGSTAAVKSVAAPAIVSIESWHQITPTASSALAYPCTLTVSGRGFHEPYSAYRCILSTDHHIVVTGAPVAYSRGRLVFEQPIWSASAAVTNVTLRRISEGADFQTYTPDTTVHFAETVVGSASVFEFKEAWETLSSPSALAMSSTVLTVTGAGFDTAHDLNVLSSEFLHIHRAENRTKYACVFSSANSSGGQLQLAATTLNNRQLTCTLLPWNLPGQVVQFRLFRGLVITPGGGEGGGGNAGGEEMGVPGDTRYSWSEVEHMKDGVNQTSNGIAFEFVQGWLSLSPSRGAIGDGTVINIVGFGFNTSSRYVCAFSSTATGNISGYSAAHQAIAGDVFACVRVRVSVFVCMLEFMYVHIYTYASIHIDIYMYAFQKNCSGKHEGSMYNIDFLYNMKKRYMIHIPCPSLFVSRAYMYTSMYVGIFTFKKMSSV